MYFNYLFINFLGPFKNNDEVQINCESNVHNFCKIVFFV